MAEEDKGFVPSGQQSTSKSEEKTQEEAQGSVSKKEKKEEKQQPSESTTEESATSSEQHRAEGETSAPASGETNDLLAEINAETTDQLKNRKSALLKRLEEEFTNKLSVSEEQREVFNTAFKNLETKLNNAMERWKKVRFVVAGIVSCGKSSVISRLDNAELENKSAEEVANEGIAKINAYAETSRPCLYQFVENGWFPQNYKDEDESLWKGATGCNWKTELKERSVRIKHLRKNVELLDLPGYEEAGKIASKKFSDESIDDVEFRVNDQKTNKEDVHRVVFLHDLFPHFFTGQDKQSNEHLLDTGDAVLLLYDALYDPDFPNKGRAQEELKEALQNLGNSHHMNLWVVQHLKKQSPHDKFEEGQVDLEKRKANVETEFEVPGKTLRCSMPGENSKAYKPKPADHKFDGYQRLRNLLNLGHPDFYKREDEERDEPAPEMWDKFKNSIIDLRKSVIDIYIQKVMDEFWAELDNAFSKKDTITFIEEGKMWDPHITNFEKRQDYVNFQTDMDKFVKENCLFGEEETKRDQAS